MSDVWGAESRLNASRSAAKRWRAKIEADPNSSKLAKARAFRKITQQDLAGLVNTSIGVISAAENGGQISPALQERLANVLALPELFP
jgi:DNA-binding XRE family transcriptional regulator